MDPSIASDQHPAGVRLFILGGFRLERDGRRIPDDVWQRRPAKRLVKLLATDPAHRLHREQIQELLWPELPLDNAANALRKALHLARRALEPGREPRHASSHLVVHDDLVQLSPETVWIDADAFQSLGNAALTTGGQAMLTQALTLYGGELLPEDRYEDWTTGPRTALADLHLSLLRELATVHERSGRDAAAIECLKQVVALDPIREHAHRQIMRLYAASGQRHQALRQYHLCRAALRQQVDGEPDPVTDVLYQEIQAGRIVGISGAARDTPLGGALPLPSPARHRLSEPFVGRSPALGSLEAALDRARDGRGETILIGGEAGVGKTRLIAELARHADDGHGRVLWGTCYEQEGQLPYGPFVEALDRVGSDQPPEHRQRLGAAYPELARLIPSFGSTSPAAELTDQDDSDRTKLFTAVVRLLEEIRGDQVLLLVLDDLHLADSATLQLLHFVAKSATARPWLILGSVRAEEVTLGGAFHRFRAAAVRDRICTRLDLERLNEHECGQLIESVLAGGAVGEALRTDCYVRSLGNPLYVYELVRAMRDQGSLRLERGRWSIADADPAVIPRRLRDLIDERIDRLGDDVRGVLALIATARGSCSFRTLRDTRLMSEECLLDALDRALTRRIIEEREGGYGFGHPLVRGTVYERLSRPRRIRIHAALAEAIERQTDPHSASPEQVEDLAYHWAEAGNAARAVPYLVRAADRAARVYANDEAIARLHRALSLLDHAPGTRLDGSPERIELLERLGDLLAHVGNSTESLAAYDAALAGAQLDRRTGPRLQRKAARQALITGDLAAADTFLAEAEAGLDDAGPDASSDLERARLLIVRSQAHFLGHRLPEALAAAEESARLAEAAGSPTDVALATEMVAMTCLTQGQWRRGMEYERGHAGLTDLNQFIMNVADVHLCLGEYFVHREPDQAVRTAKTFIHALAESERIGAPRSLALCHYYLGYAAYFGGRFSEAMSHLTESIRLYDEIGSASGQAIALMMRGVTQTALGLLEEGHQDLRRGLDSAEGATLRSHAKIRLYAGLGRNRLDANDPDGARRYVEAGLHLAEEPSTCICYAAIHPIAATAFALTGDVDRAAELGQKALAQARALNSPGFLNWSYQALAIADTMVGDWDSAFAALDTACDLAARHSFPYEHARILLLRAFVHVQRRRPRDLAAATALMAEASPMLVRLGVRASAAQARSSIGFVRSHLSARPRQHRQPA